MDCLRKRAAGKPLHLGAAAGFALALAARAGERKHSLWIQPDFAGQEAGSFYGPGLTALGLPMERLLLLRVARAVDVLWAMEEALKSGVLATVIAELTDDGPAADLTATRRSRLSAAPSHLARTERGGDTLGHRGRPEHSRRLRWFGSHRFHPLACEEPPRPARPLDHRMESP